MFRLDLNGTFLGVWLAHTAFGLPLASTCSATTSDPAILDHRVARIDGADHFTIFWRLIIPLSRSGARRAIFQFLWV